MLKAYEVIFETWRSQVDSYWQRSIYFAAFETAGIAGWWMLLPTKKKPEPGQGLGLLLAGFGFLLSIVWYWSNHIMHAYVVYWWDALSRIEESLNRGREQPCPIKDCPNPERSNLSSIDFVQQLETSRNTRNENGKEKPKCHIKYHWLVQSIPVLFGIAWVILLVRSCSYLGWLHLACIWKWEKAT
jgi:hypothetical protein